MSENQELKAGRELDRMIVEKIFGLDPWTARRGLHPDGDIEYHWGYPLGHDVAPNYSTDIAAAWQVIEHLRSQGYQFHINSLAESNNISVLISNPDKHSLGDMADFTVWEHESLPLAICLAALKAVESRNERH